MLQWQQMASFGTTSECEQYAANLKKFSADRASQNKDPRYQDMLRYAAQLIAEARCVPTDDPRLKAESDARLTAMSRRPLRESDGSRCGSSSPRTPCPG